MKFHALIFIVGLLVMLFGLYGMVPNALNSRRALMGIAFQSGPLFLILMVTLISVYWIGGEKMVEKSMVGTVRVTANFIPTLLMMFPVMATVGVLVEHYQEPINAMLVGKFGYPGTLFSAFVMPTSTAAAEPIKHFWANPASRPILLYFLTVSALVSWAVFVFRSLGLTGEIGWQMYKTNWYLAAAITPIFWLWSRAVVCGGWWKAITSIFGF